MAKSCKGEIELLANYLKGGHARGWREQRYVSASRGAGEDCDVWRGGHASPAEKLLQSLHWEMKGILPHVS